jgi:hypothetical protein
VRRVERRPDKVDVEVISVRMNSAEGLVSVCLSNDEADVVGMWRQWSPLVLSFLKLTACLPQALLWLTIHAFRQFKKGSDFSSVTLKLNPFLTDALFCTLF